MVMDSILYVYYTLNRTAQKEHAFGYKVLSNLEGGYFFARMQ